MLLARIELASYPSEGYILSVELQEPIRRRAQESNLYRLSPAAFQERCIAILPALQIIFVLPDRIERSLLVPQTNVLSVELWELYVYFTSRVIIYA